MVPSQGNLWSGTTTHDEARSWRVIDSGTQLAFSYSSAIILEKETDNTVRYESVVEKHVNQLEGWRHHQDEEIRKLRNEVRHLEEEMNFVLPIAGWLLGVLISLRGL